MKDYNEFDILDFDYEERPGTDAFRVQYYTGAVSKIDIAVKPGENKYKKTIAGLWSTNALGYDFFIIAALKNNKKFLGGAWTGDIKGAGFRGEITISDPPNKGMPSINLIPVEYGKSLLESDKNILSVALSADYSFANTFYIHTEALYNSNGKQKNAGLFQSQALEANMLSPARWSLFQEFSYNFTPLIKGSIFGIINPDDHSLITMPSVVWSAMTNLDLMFIGYVTGGNSNTEWGDAGNALFIRFKYNF